MGGQIALVYASMYPSEVKSLWLLDPAGLWSVPKTEISQEIYDKGLESIRVKNAEDTKYYLKVFFFKPPFIPGSLMYLLTQNRLHNFDTDKKVYKDIIDFSIEKRVAGMNIPALIVWGDTDRVIDMKSADVLHKLLPRSEVIIMKNTGHLPMMEEPEESAKDYLKFRKSLLH